MRILSWVKDKVNGKPEEKKKKKKNRADEDQTVSSSSYKNVSETTCKEEFSDWPNGLLAIGTFGNGAFTGDSQGYASSEASRFSGFTVDSQRYASSESSSSSQNLSNFTVEEVYKLQKELTRQLALRSKSGSFDSDAGSGRKINLQLDKLLSCPSGLDVERRSCEKICENLENEEDGDISPNTRMVLIKARDILSSDKNKKINKKSFKFLLKKMFVCGGGFANVPGLKDPIPETRMEKLLKTIFKKKMYSRYTAPATAKYLEKKPMDEEGIESEIKEETKDSRGRWVKTDSEFIVLEI